MIYLPQDFPALQSLRAEGLAATAYAMGGPCSLPPAIPQGAKRVLLLNLMPHKAVTDLDIARTLAQTGEDVCLLLMKNQMCFRSLQPKASWQQRKVMR